jgi:choline dehydrogenase-like flavoprotein
MFIRGKMFNKNEFQDSILREVPRTLHVRHVVIGSGPGGAVTACMLAEAGLEVLLIEEGEYHDLEDIRPFSLDEMKHKYRNGGLTLAFGKVKVNYVEGRCVGGGSEVNSGLYHRTPAPVLARWREEYKLGHATDEELEPFYRQCEADVCISYNPGKLPRASLKLAEGADIKGWSQQEVPRWFRYSGSMDADGVAEGVKMSMTQTYLPRMMKAGGKLVPATRCLKLEKRTGGYVLHCEKDGMSFTITATFSFVCAGAVHTPMLLRKSGMGRNVGRSFLLHPTIKATALFSEEVNQANMGVPVHQVKEFAPDFSFGCSISTPPYLALALTDHPGYGDLVNTHWRNMAIYYAMTCAEGKGSVSPVPFYRDPVVRYSLTDKEKRNLALGLRKLCELLFAAGARTVFPSISGCRALQSPEDIDSLPMVIDERTTNLMTIHLFSSCPMGEDRSRCATDSFGKLHGEEGIYVNDASLLPTAPGVNPQGTIMAFALRNIQHFIKQGQ